MGMRASVVVVVVVVVCLVVGGCVLAIGATEYRGTKYSCSRKMPSGLYACTATTHDAALPSPLYAWHVYSPRVSIARLLMSSEFPLASYTAS